MFPPYAKGLTVYEVNLRQYTPSGTIHEFLNHIPRLKKLGVGMLWLMPLHPIGSVNRKGSLGSYYSVRDYYSIDPLYGSMGDFKALVKAVHQENMLIILDWVANHTAWDNPLCKQHPEYYVKDENDSFIPPFPEWEDVIKLDYNQKDTWRYMIQAMKFWVSEADIDGFRCDMANLVPQEFWEVAIDSLRKIKPVFMLAEAEDPLLLEKGFDVIYNWKLYHVFNRFIHEKENAALLDTLIEDYLKTHSPTGNTLLFTSNHDENSWNGSALERLGSSLEASIVLTFTLPGIPLIYSGQEAGNARRLSFFDKDLIEWKQDKLFGLYQMLIDIRKNNPALWSHSYGGSFRRIPNSLNHHVFSFIRENNGNKVLVVANLSWEEAGITFNGYPVDGEYRDLISNKDVYLVPGARLVIPPWGYYILAK